MIVATRPLIDCCPIVPAAMEGRQIVQWDKDSCSDAGFLKIDLLGLGMLSAVERSVELIARTRGERIDLSRIPYDDPATYECIQNADTTGVFQIESRAQMQSLRRTRPENLKDITIQVAIVRPGPIQGGAVNPYIERRQRLRVDPDYQVPYEHPSLRAGAVGDARDDHLPGPGARGRDRLRRLHAGRGRGAAAGDEPQALGGGDRGLPRALRRGRARRKHGVDAETRRAGVRRWSRASRASASPRPTGPPSGCSPTSRPGCASTTARSSCARCSTSSRWASIRPTRSSTRRSGGGSRCWRRTSTRAASSARSSWRSGGGPECRRAVRIGLGYVRGVRGDEVEALVAARERRRALPQPLRSGLARRVERLSLELLAWSGACDSLAGWHAARLVRARRGGSRSGSSAWRPPAGAFPAAPSWRCRSICPRRPRCASCREWESMLADYGTTGLTVHAHPLALLRDRLPADAVTSRDLEPLEHGARVRVGGLVVARQRPGTASGVVFVLLEDEFGTINLIVPPKIYERHRLTVRTEPLMLVEGKLERFAAAGGAINVLVDRIGSIDAPDQILAEVKDFSMLDEQVDRAGRAAVGSEAGGRRQRGRGFPRRRAPGHELRLGAPALRPRMKGGTWDGRVALRAPHPPAAHGKVPLACLPSSPSSPSGSCSRFGLFFIAARGGLGGARAGVAETDPARQPARRLRVRVPADRLRDRAPRRAADRQPPQRQRPGRRHQAHLGREDRTRAVRPALRGLPHAGGRQRGRQGRPQPRRRSSPPASLVLHTINNGCLPNAPSGSAQQCLGYGVMPAGVVQGRQAQHVAEFVARVAGQE